MKTLLYLLGGFTLMAQPKEPSFKVQVCVEPISAYGVHTRFTTEEHLQMLLNERESREAQDWPYRAWEFAARSINWFDGKKPISLSYVKQHMPRAMLLELQFPVDQNPHVVQEDIDWLLETEKQYYEATKAAEKGQIYLQELLKKYNIGPAAIFDKDMGGATPQSDCNKYEEQEYPTK